MKNDLNKRNLSSILITYLFLSTAMFVNSTHKLIFPPSAQTGAAVVLLTGLQQGGGVPLENLLISQANQLKRLAKTPCSHSATALEKMTATLLLRKLLITAKTVYVDEVKILTLNRFNEIFYQQDDSDKIDWYMLLLYGADIANRTKAIRYARTPWTDEQLTQIVKIQCQARINEYLQVRREIFADKDKGEKVIEK